MHGIRRAVTLLVAVVATTSPATAQQFAIQGGWTQSEVLSSSAGWDRGNGFQAGVRYEMPLGGGFAVQPEVYLTRRTTRVQGGSDVLRLTSAMRLDYLEAPVLLKRTWTRGRIQPHLAAGGYVARLVSARVRTRAGRDVLDEDFGEDMKRLDSGVVVGGGVTVGPGWLAELRYTRGLSRVDVDWAADPARNRSLSVLIGRAF